MDWFAPLFFDMTDWQIIHGDCRDVLPSLEEHVDFVLTDPPYGMNLKTNFKSRGTGNLCESNDYAPVFGDDEPYDPSILLSFDSAMIWGANYFSKRLPDGGTWLVWDKRNGMAGNDYADCEIGWYSKDGSARLFNHLWNGAIRASEKDGRRCHPTQKPVALMRWCIELADLEPNSLIVDPYCGSGSSGVAAVQMGHRYIGIEIVEDYVRIARRRLEEASNNLFAVAGI